MTATVGNTPPRAVDSLLQSGTAKVPAGNFRRHAIHQDETNAQSNDVNQNTSSAEPDASRSRVDHVGKVLRREPNKDDANDDDGSFEDTFKSMGEDTAKDASANLNTPQSYPAGLLLAQTGNNQDPTKSPSETPASVARPTALLKQKSILAMMDTKDRIFSNQDAAKTDDTTAGAAFPEHSDRVAEAVPLTVDRQEVHWNFNNEAIATAAAKITALQTGSHLATQIPKQASSAGATNLQSLETKSGSTKQDIAPQAVAMGDSGQLANTASSAVATAPRMTRNRKTARFRPCKAGANRLEPMTPTRSTNC